MNKNNKIIKNKKVNTIKNNKIEVKQKIKKLNKNKLNKINNRKEIIQRHKFFSVFKIYIGTTITKHNIHTNSRPIYALFYYRLQNYILWNGWWSSLHIWFGCYIRISVVF